MIKSHRENDMHPLAGILILGVLVILGMLVGNLIGIVLFFPDALLDLTKLQKVIASPFEFEDKRINLLGVQGLSALVAFLLAPYFYLKFIRKSSLSWLKWNPEAPYSHLGIAIFIFLAALPISIFLAWVNKEFLFDQGSSFYQTLLDNEKQYEKLTAYLVNLKGPLEWIIGVLVIAVIPAIGEEVLFRGVGQNLLKKWTGNAHIAIILTAVIFGLVHGQFLSALPRIFLGLLLGYVYDWSRNIWLPIIGHFTNNFVALAMAGSGAVSVEQDINSELISSMLPTIILSFLSVLALCYYLYKKISEQQSREPVHELGMRV